MKRRQFLNAFGCALVLKPVVAQSQAAQEPKRAPIVGILDPSLPVSPTSDAQVFLFKEALRESGWVDGNNVVIERRKVGGDNELTKREAANLVDLGTAVLVGSSTVATAALAGEDEDDPHCVYRRSRAARSWVHGQSIYAEPQSNRVHHL